MKLSNFLTKLMLVLPPLSFLSGKGIVLGKVGQGIKMTEDGLSAALVASSGSLAMTAACLCSSQLPTQGLLCAATTVAWISSVKPIPGKSGATVLPTKTAAVKGIAPHEIPQFNPHQQYS